MIVKKEIRLKREDLKRGSIKLKELAFDSVLNYDGAKKIRDEQQKTEEKFQFYDKFIKASEKVKKGSDK